MKFILGALAAVAVFVGVAASQPADARCYWNGYGWQCVQRPHYGYWQQRHWGRERPYRYGYRHHWGWDRPYHRDWAWNRW